jgi:hypothetical protein
MFHVFLHFDQHLFFSKRPTGKALARLNALVLNLFKNYRPTLFLFAK